MFNIDRLSPRGRAVAGAVLGILFYLLVVVTSVLGFVFNPVTDHPTTDSFFAMLIYLFLFAATGALVGIVQSLHARVLRYAVVGALLGALVLSFQNAIWPLALRFSSAPPHRTILADGAFGAGWGALGGLLLVAVVSVGRHLTHRDS